MQYSERRWLVQYLVTPIATASLVVLAQRLRRQYAVLFLGWLQPTSQPFESLDISR